MAARAALLLAPAVAVAGGVDLTVVDGAGKPLPEVVALLEPVGAKPALRPMPDAELSQSKRQFHPRVLLITVGTRVAFPNFDTVRHHVYSFSPAKTFELKLYSGVPAAPVVFDKPGIAVLGCNIHDSMAAWVVVADTPWSGLSGEAGRIHVDNVPAGSYHLHLWHPGFVPGTEPASTPLTVPAGDIEQRTTLNVSALP